MIKDMISVNTTEEIWQAIPNPRYSVIADTTREDIDRISVDELVHFIKETEDMQAASRKFKLDESVNDYIRSKFGRTLYRFVVNYLIFRRIVERGGNRNE